MYELTRILCLVFGQERFKLIKKPSHRHCDSALADEAIALKPFKFLYLNSF